MKKFIKQIKSLKKIDKKSITGKKFLIEKHKNIEIYYAPFDYINSKAKIMIVGITPGLQQMLQSFTRQTVVKLLIVKHIVILYQVSRLIV